MANRIVEYKSTYERNVRGTKVKAGQTLYAIRDELTGMFFIWSYSNKAFAERIAGKVKIYSATDMASNWRHDLRYCVPSDRT